MPRKRTKQPPHTDDPIIQILEEIRARGGDLIEAFVAVRKDELYEILPDLKALRDMQEATLAALTEIRKSEIETITEEN